MGSSFYDLYSDLDGYPSAAIVLKQIPGSNAADVIKQVKAKLEEIKKQSFPPGMDYEITYDVSEFLDASIEKVLHTLFEAFVLVSLVVFLFLGDFRSTLDSDPGGSRLADRDLLLHADLRHVDQPDHAFRIGAGDRRRGGRRDRGGRSRA